MKKKYWSKKAKLGLLIPLLLLGTGGCAVGGLAVAGYGFGVGPLAPTANKININIIFGVNGGIKNINDASHESAAHYSTVDEVHQCMVSFLSGLASSYGKPHVMNDIDVPTLHEIPQEAGWLGVTISVKSSSQEFDGSNFTLRLYNEPPGTRTLTSDFSVKNFDCTTGDLYTLLGEKTDLSSQDIIGSDGILKALNPDLDLNDIDVQYKSGPTYTDLPTSGNVLGPNSTTLNSTWIKGDDHYANLQVNPKAHGVYAGQNAIQFIVELWRPNLSDEKDWPASNVTIFNNYIIPPSPEQIETTFRENYGDLAGGSEASWWDNSFGFIGGTTGYDNWSFVLDGNNKTAGVNFVGTPYFASVQDNSDTSSNPKYSWSYNSTAQTSLASEITVNTLAFNDDTQLTNNDVHNALLNAGCNISYWGEVSVTIVKQDFTITLQPMDGSIHYSANSGKTLSYTLPTST